jgi:hypothetical protein
MAFDLVQTFGNVDYAYDRDHDVLDISFGPPAPAVALQVEDWLALRVGSSPVLQGLTIVGFKTIFKRLNRYIEKELPERIKRIAVSKIEFAYDDTSDTLIVRVRTEAEEPGLSVFEPLMQGSDEVPYVYIEKRLPSKDIIGIKILEYTRQGQAAMETILGAIVDTVFEESQVVTENSRLMTNALIGSLDWQMFARFAA